jgi:hypothetical protein
MVVESNPMVARLCTAVAAAKEEWTMVTGRWELQTEVHYCYHVPRYDSGFHGSENDFQGGGCHTQRCL